MESEKFLRLKQLLDETIQFPSFYLFKFIVIKDKVLEVKEILLEMEITEHHSKNGQYVSISGKKNFENSAEIINIYIKASAIKGIISL